MDDDRLDLVLERMLNGPRERVWRAWTEPDLVKRWWCPKPWYVADCRIEPRPGGEFYTLMRGPEAGQEHAVTGCYLELVPHERIVFTPVLKRGFRPVPPGPGAPRFTAEITFADAGGGRTAYRARVMHPDEADRDAHARMGFEAGWGATAAQLDALLSVEG